MEQNEEDKNLICALEVELRKLTKEVTSSKVDFHRSKKLAHEKSLEADLYNQIITKQEGKIKEMERKDCQLS